MIIRMIPVRILTLLSLQGKEKICRICPAPAWLPLSLWEDDGAGSGSWNHELMV